MITAPFIQLWRSVMWRFVAALGLLSTWISPALAAGLDDARLCFKGTERPSSDYLPYCTRAIQSGELSRADLAMTHNNRGAILLGVGQEDSALADFDRALDINPGLSLSYLSRGMIRLRQENYDGALEDFSQAIEVAPRDSRGYVNRSLLYMETEQQDFALQDLEQAIAINPGDPLAYNNRAIIFYMDGHHERAYADSEMAIAFGIDTLIERGMAGPGLYQLRVEINVSLGRYEEAIVDLDRVIRLRDDIASLHNHRAWLLATVPQAELRNAKKAIRSAKIAVKLSDNPEFRDTLAAAYAEAGVFDKAIAAQEQAISMLREAGRLQEIGDYEKALEGYRQGKPRRLAEADG